jgi:hypothetical protein
MNIITYICKRANSSILELALSIGTGYPLIGCSPAEPISVLPVLINITNLITDTVQFTLPQHLLVSVFDVLFLLPIEAVPLL